jgi:hypothetical protein
MCDVPYDLYGFYGGFKPVPVGMYLIYADWLMISSEVIRAAAPCRRPLASPEQGEP